MPHIAPRAQARQQLGGRRQPTARFPALPSLPSPAQPISNILPLPGSAPAPFISPEERGRATRLGFARGFAQTPFPTGQFVDIGGGFRVFQPPPLGGIAAPILGGIAGAVGARQTLAQREQAERARQREAGRREREQIRREKSAEARQERRDVRLRRQELEDEARALDIDPTQIPDTNQLQSSITAERQRRTLQAEDITEEERERKRARADLEIEILEEKLKSFSEVKDTVKATIRSAGGDLVSIDSSTGKLLWKTTIDEAKALENRAKIIFNKASVEQIGKAQIWAEDKGLVIKGVDVIDNMTFLRWHDASNGGKTEAPDLEKLQEQEKKEGFIQRAKEGLKSLFIRPETTAVIAPTAPRQFAFNPNKEKLKELIQRQQIKALRLPQVAFTDIEREAINKFLEQDIALDPRLIVDSVFRVERLRDPDITINQVVRNLLALGVIEATQITE